MSHHFNISLITLTQIKSNHPVDPQQIIQQPNVACQDWRQGPDWSLADQGLETVS